MSGHFDDDRWHNVGEDLDRILNLASSLCNEPYLSLPRVHKEFSCSRGSKFIRWLEERWFSEIHIRDYQPFYNRVIEKQFSRWKPTRIDVLHAGVGPEFDFIQEHLISRKLRRFEFTVARDEDMLPARVMEGIIRTFLENPNDYSAEDFHIRANFECGTDKILEAMAEEGLCKVEEEEERYIFDSQLPHLCVVMPGGERTY